VLALSGFDETLGYGVTPKFLIPLLRSRPQVKKEKRGKKNSRLKGLKERESI
jgi:hypothetical protein